MADNKNDGRGGTAVAIVAAGLGGGLLAGILASRPAEAAPDTTKIDYITKLLEAMGVTQEAILTAIKAINIPSGGINVTVQTPWVAQEPITIFDDIVNAAGDFDANQFVDMRNSKRLVLMAESSLDVNVSIQMVGNIDNAKDTETDINGPVPLVAGANVSIGLAWDDWLPYIGCRVLVPVSPTSGRLTIRVVTQD